MTTAHAAADARNVLAAGAGQRTHSAWARMSQAWKRFRAYRATRIDLQSLTDRQLVDAGLTRATLDETARRATYGQ